MLSGNWYTTKDQICTPDWCGVTSFTSWDNRCKNLVQQEQPSGILYPRAGNEDQNLNSLTESKLNPSNYLCMEIICKHSEHLNDHLVRLETSLPVTKRTKKFWKAMKKKSNCNTSISKCKKIICTAYCLLPIAEKLFLILKFGRIKSRFVCIWKTIENTWKAILAFNSDHATGFLATTPACDLGMAEDATIHLKFCGCVLTAPGMPDLPMIPWV